MLRTRLVHQDAPETMEFRFSYVSTYTDGWLEIREQDNIEAWIACDDPAPVEE